jgi:hypothetical protein
MNRLRKKGWVDFRQRSTDQPVPNDRRDWLLHSNLLLTQLKSPRGGIRVFKKQNYSYLGKISCYNNRLQTGGWPKATSDNRLRRDARGCRSSEGESWGALGANSLARRVFSAADAVGLT